MVVGSVLARAGRIVTQLVPRHDVLAARPVHAPEHDIGLDSAKVFRREPQLARFGRERQLHHLSSCFTMSTTALTSPPPTSQSRGEAGSSAPASSGSGVVMKPATSRVHVGGQRRAHSRDRFVPVRLPGWEAQRRPDLEGIERSVPYPVPNSRAVDEQQLRRLLDRQRLARLLGQVGRRRPQHGLPNAALVADSLGSRRAREASTPPPPSVGSQLHPASREGRGTTPQRTRPRRLRIPRVAPPSSRRSRPSRTIYSIAVNCAPDSRWLRLS